MTDVLRRPEQTFDSPETLNALAPTAPQAETALQAEVASIAELLGPHPNKGHIGGKALKGFMSPAALEALNRVFPTPGLIVDTALVIGDGRDLGQAPVHETFRGDADAYSTFRSK